MLLNDTLLILKTAVAPTVIASEAISHFKKYEKVTSGATARFFRPQQKCTTRCLTHRVNVLFHPPLSYGLI